MLKHEQREFLLRCEEIRNTLESLVRDKRKEGDKFYSDQAEESLTKSYDIIIRLIEVYK